MPKCKICNTLITIQSKTNLCNSCTKLGSSNGLYKHGESKTYIYALWHNIKQRCLNKLHRDFKNYGGRGIIMYEPWIHDYIAFRDYILSTIRQRPSKAHSIDRKNNSLGYIPGNLRWATKKQQRMNQNKIGDK